MEITTIEDFYRKMADAVMEPGYLLPDGISREIGHFNVFDIKQLTEHLKRRAVMPYNRRAYYKISFVRGRNRAEYADRVFNIEQSALLFATPRVPYHWVPQDLDQAGHFCVFTNEFLVQAKSGVMLDELPIFKAGGYPVFLLEDEMAAEIESLFRKMHRELAGDYAYKYDLIRNYVLELIHTGQKLQPATAMHSTHNAAARVSSLFIELLERQFPIESTHQRLGLRTAKDFAERLAVHVNHLNKVLKETTGRTTTEIIGSRVAQEAKMLLRQTDWNISEIAYCLGFEEVAHFSNFFKKQASVSPVQYRV